MTLDCYNNCEKFDINSLYTYAKNDVTPTYYFSYINAVLEYVRRLKQDIILTKDEKEYIISPSSYFKNVKYIPPQQYYHIINEVFVSQNYVFIDPRDKLYSRGGMQTGFMFDLRIKPNYDVPLADGHKEIHEVTNILSGLFKDSYIIKFRDIEIPFETNPQRLYNNIQQIQNIVFPYDLQYLMNTQLQMLQLGFSYTDLNNFTVPECNEYIRIYKQATTTTDE